MTTRRRRSRQPRFGLGLFVGLGTGALVSTIVVYFIMRRRKVPATMTAPAPTAGPVLQLAAPPPLPGPKIAAPREVVREEPQRAVPVTKSIELPAPGVDAVRLVSSTDRAYTAQIRAVDPAGGFAIIAFDANELNIAGAVPIPQGNNLIIPVGQWQTIPMGPHQSLYGRGSVVGVTVSVSGHEAS